MAWLHTGVLAGSRPERSGLRFLRPCCCGPAPGHPGRFHLDYGLPRLDANDRSELHTDELIRVFTLSPVETRE
jgi:hypothetical protein